MKNKKFYILSIILILCLGIYCAINVIRNKNHTMTGYELIGAGWNLGNSLDTIDNKKLTENQAREIGKDSVSHYYENLWGNPVTTRDMIKKVKEAGFKTVRVPVTYSDHIDKNGVIDSKWLARVKEIVDYVIDEDMKCIINLHHDVGVNARINAEPSQYEENKKQLQTNWKQIAEYFKDYNDLLMFEGFNEILDRKNNWDCKGQEYIDTVNKLNQDFVDIVRSTGGNNNTRYLIVNTYAAATSSNVIEGFKLPQDDKKNKLIVQVHCYSKVEDLPEVFKRLKENFVDENIPLVIGEMGMSFKDSQNDDQQLLFAKKFVELAKKYNIGYCYWDDGKDFKLLDRRKNVWNHEDIVRELTKK